MMGRSKIQAKNKVRKNTSNKFLLCVHLYFNYLIDQFYKLTMKKKKKEWANNQFRL